MRTDGDGFDGAQVHRIAGVPQPLALVVGREPGPFDPFPSTSSRR
jgi:hypothetical protein